MADTIGEKYTVGGPSRGFVKHLGFPYSQASSASQS